MTNLHLNPDIPVYLVIAVAVVIEWACSYIPTDNLSRIMKTVGSLDEAKKRASPPEWDVIMANVRYILREILNGLDYLHSLNIQHCDVKGMWRWRYCGSLLYV